MGKPTTYLFYNCRSEYSANMDFYSINVPDKTGLNTFMPIPTKYEPR